MYTRTRLQVGSPPPQGDRYCYLVLQHSWWAVATREAFAKACGVTEPDALHVSNAMFL